MSHEQILSEYKQICAQITSIKEQLSHLPKGKLICAHNGNSYKWYQSDGSKKHYIRKKEQSLAEQLAFKKYLTLSLEDLEKKQIALQFYLRHYSPSFKAEQLLASPEYAKLLLPYFTPLSQELSEWQNTSYDHNMHYPEQLIHKGSSGTYLRSKSEAMIDMVLYKNKIPFRYECALTLSETTLYPDFTIRHPHTGTFYYWEHFGLMDNPSYYKNTYSKLQLYTSHGIIPSIQLIATYETQKNPLCIETIEAIVHHYFQ